MIVWQLAASRTWLGLLNVGTVGSLLRSLLKTTLL